MKIRWSIRNKLLAAFGVVVAMLVILVVANWIMMSSGIREAELARDRGYAGASLATDIKYDVTQVWQWLTDISATRGAEGFDDGFDEAEQYAQLFRQHVAALMEIHPDNRERLEELSRSFDAFYAKGKEMAQAYIDGGPAQGNQAMLEFDAYAGNISTKLDALVAEMDGEAQASIQAVVEANTRSRIVGLGIAMVAVPLAVIIAFGLSRSMSRAAQEMVEVAEQISQVDLTTLAAATAAMANGDLTTSVTVETQEVTYKSGDEMGDLARAFNQMIVRLQESGRSFDNMIANLRRLVGQVADSATSVSAAAGQLTASADQSAEATNQVAATIQQIATGTSQQTASVTNATTTVEQVSRAIEGVARGAQEQAASVGSSAEITARISTAVQQVSANAQAGARGASEAAQAARAGAETVQKTVKGIESIKISSDVVAQRIGEMGRRSEQIGAIVETIDDIASQTNLLALNAAIEAARAGEHGKGFAVVADEVRKLAENATQSTSEISALIKEVQRTIAEAVQAMNEGSTEVEAGMVQANEAGQALDTILIAAEAVNRQVEEIAAAAQMMDASTNELVGAMDSVSAVVEENTAATEEMAASAGEVSQAIENIAAISEENSAATEEVSASVEEVTAQVEEVTASAQSLSAMAQELQALVAQFKLPGVGRTQEQGDATLLTDTVWATAPQPVRTAPVASPGGDGYRYKESKV
jgi:methyl-accepting chemotaxis protein